VLLLQPIVENAVVHGLDAGQQELMIRIEAASTNEGVEILVENNGPEIAAAAQKGHGLGLSTTRARLMTAYGDRASLTLKPREGGGVRVRIVLPRKVAPISNLEPVVARA
jgi:two-component system LytT family sensor kinase